MMKHDSLAEPEPITIIRRPEAAPSHRPRLAEAVRAGLLSRLRTLPWEYFYDADGSALFEQICELPEYYLTRTEDAILRDHAPEMVAGLDGDPTLIELGSGSASKTRRLIAAALEHYGTLHYVPIDVSPTILEESARTLVRLFPRLRVTGHVASYRTGLASLAARHPGPKLLVFLGSSLGNYETDDAAGLLDQVARALGPDDRFLLGTDMAKDRALLEAAYDDAQGVTARFNRNILVRINRELGADFDLDAFEHEARYRPDLGRVEMHLVSRKDQLVTIPGAGLEVAFAARESIHTENSHKYTVDGLRTLADRSGFVEEASWTDRRGFFRVQRWQAPPSKRP